MRPDARATTVGLGGFFLISRCVVKKSSRPVDEKSVTCATFGARPRTPGPHKGTTIMNGLCNKADILPMISGSSRLAGTGHRDTSASMEGSFRATRAPKGKAVTCDTNRV